MLYGIRYAVFMYGNRVGRSLKHDFHLIQRIDAHVAQIPGSLEVESSVIIKLAVVGSEMNKWKHLGGFDVCQG